MKSISFPRMLNKNSIRLKSDHEAVGQNLRVLLGCEQGQMLDDPYFGINLKRYLFDQNNSVLKDILIDEIYTQVAIFMPQIRINRKDISITQSGIDLYCTIKATNMLDYTTDMYNIVLFQGENQ